MPLDKEAMREYMRARRAATRGDPVPAESAPVGREPNKPRERAATEGARAVRERARVAAPPSPPIPASVGDAIRRATQAERDAILRRAFPARHESR